MDIATLNHLEIRVSHVISLLNSKKASMDNDYFSTIMIKLNSLLRAIRTGDIEEYLRKKPLNGAVRYYYDSSSDLDDDVLNGLDDLERALMKLYDSLK